VVSKFKKSKIFEIVYSSLGGGGGGVKIKKMKKKSKAFHSFGIFFLV
jgi:hypothetical protein